MEYLFSDGSLSFTGQDCECIPPWLARKYGAETKRLDLSYNRIRSVKGLAGFNNLKELILDNNRIANEVEFPFIEALETLTINKNLITNLDNFLRKISTQLPNLTYLSMLGNEACPNQLSNQDNDDGDYMRYRYYVLFWLPSLKFLDSTTVTLAERKEAKRVGGFMKTVSSDGESMASEQCSNNYTALPATKFTEKKNKSSFGKCRYVYYGKHSEGNRFIVNNDL